MKVLVSFFTLFACILVCTAGSTQVFDVTHTDELSHNSSVVMNLQPGTGVYKGVYVAFGPKTCLRVGHHDDATVEIFEASHGLQWGTIFNTSGTLALGEHGDLDMVFWVSEEELEEHTEFTCVLRVGQDFLLRYTFTRPVMDEAHHHLWSTFGGASSGGMNETHFSIMHEYILDDKLFSTNGTVEEEAADDHHHDHNHGRLLLRSRATTVVVECKNSSEAFAAADLDRNGVLDAREMVAATAHIYLMFKAGCSSRATTLPNSCTPTTAQSWGYGMLAVVIVSLIGLLTIIFIPVNSDSFRKYFLVVLVAFAVGAILGDAVFHILPALMYLHMHDASAPSYSYMWLLATVAATIVVFFVIERLLHLLHDHHDSPSDVANDLPLSSPSIGQHPGDAMSPAKPAASIKDIKVFGWLNLVSDGFHNFIDGLAMGASFATSLSLGLATSIAVAVHEIPQELGDFAVLVDAGFSRWAAVGVNLLSALPAIVGFCIGLPLSTAADAQPWLLAITVGGFLYIGFAALLPELQKAQGKILTALSMLSMSIGFLALILLAVYEENLIGAIANC